METLMEAGRGAVLLTKWCSFEKDISKLDLNVQVCQTISSLPHWSDYFFVHPKDLDSGNVLIGVLYLTLLLSGL